MPRLTPEQRMDILREHGFSSDKTGERHWSKNLEIHHRDRDPENDAPSNVQVLTHEEHMALHGALATDQALPRARSHPVETYPMSRY